MNYSVRWNPDLTDDLQRMYDEALDQEALVNAIHRIELELSAKPHEAGESREQDLRVLFKYPLIAWFRLNERMKEVLIIRVRAYHG